MRILVIGGSYFLGKAFVETALNQEGDRIFVLNRQSRPMAFHNRLTALKADRHDTEALREAFLGAGEDYDAVVDFCAYEKGDISTVLSAMDKAGIKARHYVMISTVDVYDQTVRERVTEQSPLERRLFGGQEGAYIAGKVALEDELSEEAAKRGLYATSLRPAFLYGPGNYAPREGLFFFWIAKAGQIIMPEGADGFWQMLYVGDAARMIQHFVQKGPVKAGRVRARNLLPGEATDYESFYQALRQGLPVSFTPLYLSFDQIRERDVPLPFPLTKEESRLYVSDEEPAFYTPLSEGLKRSWEAENGA